MDLDLDLDLDLDVLRSADPEPMDGSLLVLQGQHLSHARVGRIVRGLEFVGSRQANDLKGGKVKFKWLRDRFTGQVEEGAEQEIVERQARGYILLLLGETIFADHTRGYVHLAYLQLLENFDVAGEYSWGSAALTNLYHNLCHGRLGKRAPKPGSPLIGRWDDAFGCPDLATHVVGAYRHHLDIQRADEVKCNPYSDKLLDSLPEYCTAGRAVWWASGIPRQSRAREPLHGKTLQSGKKDWAAEYAPIIAIWNARLQHVVEAGCPDLPVYPFDDPYVTWYNRMSSHCISWVGAGIDGADPEVDEEEQQLGEEGQGLPKQPIPQQEAAAFKAPLPIPTPAAGLLVVEGSSSVVASGVVIAGTCKD
ncbi:hypothetical protein Vadar_034771 [Vaccinium darrowii]|uniref:Uncharacterized protein n=1 Tax=Vaccinium darrowii TaxID=229202 RepID=A0ACB7Z264_9ERIC|nr:hypothetical protein Vadar_034771 [Vaccinium darrowii]